MINSKKFWLREEPASLTRLLVVSLCWKKKIEVINVDALSHAGHLRLLEPLSNHPARRFVHSDIRDGKALSELVDEEAPDAKMHLAAESYVDRSIEVPAAFIDTNIVGRYKLLNAVHQH
jgi:dTDP-glucose 4,6-dehydratase